MNSSRETFPVQPTDAYPAASAELLAEPTEASREGIYNGERKDQTHELRQNPLIPSATGQASGVSQPLSGSSTMTLQSSEVALSHDAVSEAIERESVAKAKAIIASTQNDPYEESNKISELKIDYLQQKYGKHLKMSEQ